IAARSVITLVKARAPSPSGMELDLLKDVPLVMHVLLLFVFGVIATTEISTLSLHDALPISSWSGAAHDRALLFGRPGSVGAPLRDRKSTRLNSSHVSISYAVFCLKKKK